MFIKQGEHVQAARLFSFLTLGEELAHFCAKEQAGRVENQNMRRFFKTQTRQEHYHRIIFQRGVLILTPKGCSCDPVQKPMQEYKNLLVDALKDNNLAETLLGQQVLLEGLGETVLENIDYGMRNRKFGFQRIRHVVLSQEHAHHQFGLRKLNEWVREDESKKQALSLRVQDYLHLIEQMLISLQDLFEYFNYDAMQYLGDVQHKLPDWVVVEA